MSDTSDTIYKSLFVGVTIFVGGIVAAVLLIRYLTEQGIIGLNAGSPGLGSSSPPSIILLDQNDEERLSGEVYNMNITVNGNTVYSFDKTDNGDDINWASCVIENMGPGPLYYSINRWTRPESALAAGQNIPIDLKRRGAIRKFYFMTDAGQTTTVNIHAVG